MKLSQLTTQQKLTVLWLGLVYAALGVLIIISIMPYYIRAGIMFNGPLLVKASPPPLGSKEVNQACAFFAIGGFALALTFVYLGRPLWLSALYVILNPLGQIGGCISLMVPLQGLGARGVFNSLAFFSLPTLHWLLCGGIFMLLIHVTELKRVGSQKG